MAAIIKLINVEGKYKKFALPLTSREQYDALRASAQETVDAVRNGDATKKRNLPQVAFCVDTYSDEPVLLESLEIQNDSYIFDVDCGNQEEAYRIAQQIVNMKDATDPTAIEITVNYGVHLIGKRLPGTTILENQVRVATLLHTEMDTNCHDVHHVLYQTGPNELYYLDERLFTPTMTYDEAHAEYLRMKEREAKHQEQLPTNAHKSNKHYRPWEDNGAGETTAPIVKKTLDNKTESTSSDTGTPLLYNGIPYSEIVARYWQLQNNGNEPCEGDRNVLTFELARQIRGICNFDRNLLDKIIPCYAGFPQEEKMQCIDRALSYPMSFMPTKLRQVLESFSNNDTASLMASNMAEAQERYEQMFAQRIDCKKLARCIQASFESLSPLMVMPVLTFLGPIIGGLATGVRLSCHGKMKNLNLLGFVCGSAGSGKSNFDDLYEVWCEEQIRIDAVYEAQEDEWEQKKREAEGSDKQPKEIRLPKRMQTCRTTLPKIMQRFRDAKGQHLISYESEADVLSENVQAYKVLKLLLRYAYGGDRFASDVKSVKSTNTTVKSVLWNVVLCGTGDALYRLVQQQNLTDGLLSRMSIASMPDNTYKYLDRKHYHRSERACNRIRRVEHLLPLMRGDVNLEKLEDWAVEWVNDICRQAADSSDKAMAELRIRTCVSAMRYTCCIMLCQYAEMLLKKLDDRGANPLPSWADKCETAEDYLRLHPDAVVKGLVPLQRPIMQNVYCALADYFLQNALYYFRQRIEKLQTDSAFSLPQRQVQRGPNDGYLDDLQDTFTLTQCTELRDGNENAARCMVRSWIQRGLIRELLGKERPAGAPSKAKYYQKWTSKQ